MKQTVKPFHFHLQQLSRKNLELQNHFFSLFPSVFADSSFHNILQQSLKKHLSAQVEMKSESFKVIPADEMLKTASESSILLVLQLDPSPARIILELDQLLVENIVNKMLGGTKALTQQRKVSNIELGVLEYLLLQVIKDVHKYSAPNIPMHFRFETFVNSRQELKNYEEKNSSYFLFTERIHLDGLTAFVRFYFPQTGLQEYSQRFSSPHLESLAEYKNFPFVRVPLWAEIGKITLSPEEISQIEVGDVIMFEQNELSLNDKDISGNLILRVGNGKNAGILSEVSVKKKTITCTLLESQEGDGL